MLWSVAGLALAIALAPLYVSLCQSLSRLTGRGARRLVAVQRGTAELERLRADSGRAVSREFAVPDLPGGRCSVSVSPANGRLRQVDLLITWDENGATARAEWTTLVGKG
jgi:hypothetical protein